MNTLVELLSSRTRAGILGLLFGLDPAPLHIRELARRSGLHEASVRQELRKLTRLQLVTQKRDGNRTYYWANRQHPLYPELHGLVLKTLGLVELLRDALERGSIDVAFVFGSIAQGTQSASSDIDLMVIGKLGLRQLTAMLSGLSATLGREINSHVMSADEYSRRLAAGDHFVTHVLDGPKLFVRGSAHELAAMAE